ncbi:MAG: hypothetical protein F6K30_06045 [Cyanothece sp. SIO2G6]|nr:hypothetical protein [Cyanothece sp. SIO2G6]
MPTAWALYLNFRTGLVYLEIPLAIYQEINAEFAAISKVIEEKLVTTFLHRYEGTWIGGIAISRQLKESDNWQQDARNWLVGKGITNQGRVRSNNIANRECDGLLFRSGPEINIYRALKSRGMAFAPFQLGFAQY